MLKASTRAFILATALMAAGSAHSFDDGLKKQLMRLEPTARLEQTCDTELMLRLNKEHKLRVDKVIAYTFSDPSYKGDSIKAPGASFRARGDWYHLSYECRTGPRRLDVQALRYEIGDKIEREDWKKYSLYN